MSKNYSDIVLTSLPDRELQIIGKISAERMADLRKEAIKKLTESVGIDGFRKGNAPENMIIAKVGEMKLLEEAAEIALSEEYPNILDEHKVDAIGRPNISITKIGIGSALEFSVRTALMPEVKLADYKKLVSKLNETERKPIEVTEKEIDETVLMLRKNVAHHLVHQKDGVDAHDHSHGDIKDEDLPAIDENFLKLLGDFKTVEELKTKIKEDISTEKTLKAKDKSRIEMLDVLIEKSEISLPKIIVDGELEKMVAQFKDDIGRSGIPYDDYLKHIKKSEEDLRAEWKETAVKRAKSQIILNEIAKAENITPEESEIKKEVDHIIETNKEADRFRVRMYVETFLTNELVFKFLEKLD